MLQKNAVLLSTHQLTIKLKQTVIRDEYCIFPPQISKIQIDLPNIPTSRSLRLSWCTLANDLFVLADGNDFYRFSYNLHQVSPTLWNTTTRPETQVTRTTTGNPTDHRHQWSTTIGTHWLFLNDFLQDFFFYLISISIFYLTMNMACFRSLTHQ